MGDPNPFLDIYDVASDCRHPRILSSTQIVPGKGREGWFSPDGLTDYVSATRNAEAVQLATLFPVDISDPTRPR